MNHWAFKDSQRVILCCSSTRHRRFIDDLVSVMALPEGCWVRLRYGEGNCDKSVRALVDESCVSGTTSILITHVRFDGRDAHFLPLRVGTLVALKSQGSVTYLDVELQQFVQPLIGHSFKESLETVATESLPHMPDVGEVPEGAFCQLLASPPPITTANDSALWEKVAGSFLEAIKGSNAVFPFVYRLEVLERTSSGTRSVPIRGGAFIIPSVSRIEIQLRTLVDKALFNKVIEKPVGLIKVGVEHPELSLVSRDTLFIDTTRNLTTSRVASKLGLRAAHGSLTLTARLNRNRDGIIRKRAAIENEVKPVLPVNNKKKTKYVVDEIITEIPVTVGRPVVRWSAACALAFTAAAHRFDLRVYASHEWEMWMQSGLVFAGVLFALWLGLKPQSGS